MGAYLLVILSVYILTFALMATAQRADDATELMKFDADLPPALRRIAGEALPVLASPAPYCRFEVVAAE